MSLPVIAITNESTVLTDDQIKAAIPALQRQVSFDFKGFWNTDCELVFLSKDSPLTMGWWQIVIVDDPDQAGALGYHELSSVGTPLGKVFARLDIRSNMSWTVTLSHELLEMLVDPWINLCAEGPDGRIYALEVSDAVEADELGYKIGDVLVSDFVTPAWFQPQVGSKVDFQDRITKSLELASGGYISVLEAQGWTQLTARGVSALNTKSEVVFRKTIPAGSRRDRRATPRSLWRKSEKVS